ncbi:MAG TPA: YDG domain-containing protein [Burkholderiaceae bacterium]
MHGHASQNKIFRLVWNAARRAWVAVAETARGRGGKTRRRAAASTLLLGAAHALAGPQGGTVTSGSATIRQAGSVTTITQSSSNVALDWQSFDTTAQESVRFVQPSATAVAVNRISDTSATRFFGRLDANGQVWLINPNGVLFGASSQVDVGGLVASTLDLAPGGGAHFEGAGTGSIVNQGHISAAEGGYVALVGNTVGNAGSISAPLGSVALAAGSDVSLTFAQDRLLSVTVKRSTLNNLAENGGLIAADGGTVLLSAGARDAVLASAVNNSGIVEARSVHAVDGTIVLDGGGSGSASNSGTLDASGRAAGETGGTVHVLSGNAVNLAAGSLVDVSGDAGGGTALVGGNFQGGGSEQHALAATVAAGAGIRADALTTGQGGTAVVWSDGSTQFDGGISARGGTQAGNGGQVETSGHRLKVSASAAVDTSAPGGTAGNWLLDPDDVVIGNASLWGSSFHIDVDSVALTNALNSGSVTVKTTASHGSCSGVACTTGTAGNGDIVILDFIGAVSDYNNGGFGYNWTSGSTLTLSAYRDIHFVTTTGVPNATDPTGSSTTWGGGIEIDGPGKAVLHADNAARGTGTVRFDDNFNSFLYAGNSSSAIDIYYSPTSFSSPTDYSIYDAGGAGTITSYMAVNVGVTIANKTYDGTTSAVIHSAPTVASLPSGVTVSTAGATAQFSDKNAGTGKSVSLLGVTFGGGGTTTTDGSGQHYYLNGLASATADIAKADLAVSGVSASNKTYDATTTATLTGTASVTALGGDVVSVSGTGIGTFADKNAGSNKAVTVTGYTLAGTDAGNYNVIQPTGLTATISKADLAVSGVSANNKTYDTTTTATLTGTASVTALGSDVVSVTGTGIGTFVDKNAGSNKSVTVTGYTLAGTDAGNYNVIQPAGLTATIAKADLAVSGVTASDKTYDATVAATLSGTASVTALGSDVVSVSGTGVGTFVDKNAGSNKAVTVTGYTLAGTDAGNYNVIQPTGLTATIAKADLAVSGVTASNKTYDTTTSATLTGTASVTALGSDVVSVSGTGIGTFADKNAGSNKAVTVTGYTLTGTDAGNYNVIQPAGLTATIDKADLAVSGVTASNKTYDATTAATLSGAASVTALGSDVVSVSGTGIGTFVDKNAGSNKSVAVTGYTLAGTDAVNYNIVQPTGLTATIDKADLAVSGITAGNKTYDATTAATLSGTASVTALGSDIVSVSGTGLGAFSDKNAGSNKSVTVTGYTLAGTDAGNYSVIQPTGLTATISKADLAVSGVTASNKTYDTTTSATLTGTASVTALGTDVVSVTGTGIGTFVDKNAGSNKSVTVTGYTLAGTDAVNYNIVQPTGLTATISKADLAVSGVSASNKTYDATTTATLTGTASVTALGGDVVSLTGTGIGTFVDKNAGSNKSVTVTGYTLAGTDAGNYNVIQPTGLTATIAKADLAVSGVTASNKTYDTTTSATLIGTASVTALGSDVVSVSGTGIGTFADKNAGSNKAVTVAGYTLTGTDAGNYNVIQPAGLTATISKADLAVSGVTASNKTYDATTAATLSGTASVTALGSDMVSVTGTGIGTFADKNAGSNKSVTVTGYTLAGTDAANYNVIQPTGLTATIAKADLAVSGITASNKTYDATTNATLAGTASVTALGSDVVSVSGTGIGTFADKNAGSNKSVTVTGYTLAGTDAGNYTIEQPTGLTASIAQAPLVVSGITAADKVFDGSTAAVVSTANAELQGLQAGDQVTLSATGAFTDAAIGAGKTVTLSSSYGGADVGNYAIVGQASASASILAASAGTPPPPTVSPTQQAVLANVVPMIQSGGLSLASATATLPSDAGVDAPSVVAIPTAPPALSVSASSQQAPRPLELLAPQFESPPIVVSSPNARLTLQIRRGGVRLPSAPNAE